MAQRSPGGYKSYGYGLAQAESRSRQRIGSRIQHPKEMESLLAEEIMLKQLQSSGSLEPLREENSSSPQQPTPFRQHSEFQKSVHASPARYQMDEEKSQYKALEEWNQRS